MPPRKKTAAPADVKAAVDLTRAEQRMRAAMGARIREVRAQRQLTGRRLAELSDVTPAFISQVELGQVTPSLATLLRIAHALGITVGDLFYARPPRAGQPLKPEDWDIFQYPGDPSEDALLTIDPHRRFEVLWSRFASGAATSGTEGHTHTADIQFVFVLRGTIELTLEGEMHTLDERSSITFDGRTPHFWKNDTAEPAEVLSFLSPAVL
jgi:transcriptional regulator with XRE-family HTH domain